MWFRGEGEVVFARGIFTITDTMPAVTAINVNRVLNRTVFRQFQSLTNLPCGLESNNNMATAGVSMDEEDGSADDDEHIRQRRYDGGEDDHEPCNAATSGYGTDGGGGAVHGAVIEKLCIEYPKKYRNVRSMSLSMERNAFCELCRASRSPVPSSFDAAGNGGSERDDGDNGKAAGARLYFGFTAKQYMALASLALVDFLGFCSMSVMAPTFPKEVNMCNTASRPIGPLFLAKTAVRGPS